MMKRSLIVLVSFVLWIALFEGIAALWTERAGDPLDKAKRVLMVDGALGWRQRPNYRGRFLGKALSTNEAGLRSSSLRDADGESRTVLVLGPSSAFGWGVEEDETYASRLEKALRTRYPGVKIRVINAGQIGFSSWQGLLFYQTFFAAAGLKADVLIIAYGVNDVDRYRFFFNSPLPDSKEFLRPRSKRYVAFYNFLNRFSFINLSTRRLSDLLRQWGCVFHKDLLRPADPVPPLRVGAKDLDDNLRQLIRLGRGQGASVVLLTSPFQIFELSKDPAGQDEAGTYYALGRRAYQKGSFEEALGYFEKSALADPDQNEVHYYLSACQARLGDCRAGYRSFEEARRSEPGRIARDLGKVNRLITSVGLSEDVLVSDAALYLDPAREKGLFVDPIHPSPEGHALIAQDLARLVVGGDLLKLEGGRN